MKKIASESEYKARIIDEKVENYLKVFGAACIEGPKWCGKTWTSSHHSKSEFLIGNPENQFQNRKLAEMSPTIVLDGETPRLLDEWQEVPSLWDAVRYEVDQRNRKGQFILTGSSTPKAKGILHSGAGRIGRLRMRTMSLYEAGYSSGAISLKDLCNGEIKTQLTGEVDLKDLADYIVRGGWPGNISTDKENAFYLPKSYIEAIIRDDSHRIDGKKYDTDKMMLLLKSLARNECTTASKNKLLQDIKKNDDELLDMDTVTSYLDVFDRLFIIENQLPFSSNLRSTVRIKQAEKRHFCDPALACALLNCNADRLINDLNTFVFLFESLCERDLRIYAESFNANLYHYQDYKGKEIDAVIELENGNWCAFEIKLGANQIEKAAMNLLSVKESIEKEGGKAPSVCCVLCGLTNAAYQREDGVFVIPITALKN